MRTPDATARAILDDILENPADDLPRLAYADLLEEAGGCERAGFIRLQFALEAAIREPGRPPGPVERYGWHVTKHREEAVLRAAEGGSWPCRCERCLLKREAALLMDRAHRWEDSPPGEGWVLSARELRTFREASYRRGFIEAVRCPAADWLAHGPAICALHPVERVEISDKSPVEWGVLGAVWWAPGGMAGRDFSEEWDQRPGTLPAPLWRMMGLPDHVSYVRYDSEADALDALSAACLAWAKSPPA